MSILFRHRKREFAVTMGLLFMMPFLMSGCSNFFEPLADKGFYKAVLFDAKTALANGEYTEAISAITDGMSSDEQSKYEVRWILAQAYSGACGMDAIQQVIDLGELGTTNFFPILFTQFAGATADEQAFCDLAITTIQTFGSAAQRSTLQNYLMLFAGLAKMGVYSSRVGDTAGDGTVDAGWQPCLDAELDSAVVDEVTMSWGNMYQSLAALISAGETSVSDLSSISTLCTTIATIDTSYDICSVTSSAAVTTQERITMRCLLDGPDLGFSIDYADVATCIDHAGNNNCEGP